VGGGGKLHLVGVDLGGPFGLEFAQGKGNSYHGEADEGEGWVGGVKDVVVERAYLFGGPVEAFDFEEREVECIAGTQDDQIYSLKRLLPLLVSDYNITTGLNLQNSPHFPLHVLLSPDELIIRRDAPCMSSNQKALLDRQTTVPCNVLARLLGAQKQGSLVRKSTVFLIGVRVDYLASKAILPWEYRGYRVLVMSVCYHNGIEFVNLGCL